MIIRITIMMIIIIMIMGYENHENTSDNRCTWSDQKGDGKIHQ